MCTLGKGRVLARLGWVKNERTREAGCPWHRDRKKKKLLRKKLALLHRHKDAQVEGVSNTYGTLSVYLIR
jgi:hypothetical protein